MKWPASQGAIFVLRRVVATARELAEESLAGNAFCPLEPLEYGIESISGIFNRLSNSSGRPIFRFNTNPRKNASAMPSAKPPPASTRETLLRVLVSSEGGEGRWTALMLGIFDGSKASSTRAFSSDAEK